MSRKRRRLSPGLNGLLLAVLLILAGGAAGAQQLDERELDTTAHQTFRFLSYEGPPPVIQSVPQIEGIGEVLSRGLKGGQQGEYFGKYSVIRAWKPSDTTLLGADIIVFGPRAGLDDVRNVQRIVAGYLAAAFGYARPQAGALAALVTNYNAAYRGNMTALSAKYTPLVMSYLSADNAGLAVDYRQWPGHTRLIVPLASAAAAPASTSAGTSAGTSPGGQAAPGPGGAAGSAAARPGQAQQPGTGQAPQAPGTGAAAQQSGPAGQAAAAPGQAAGAAGAAAPSGSASGPTAAAPGAGDSAAGPAATAGSSTSTGQSSSAAASSQRPGQFHFNMFWLLALAGLLLLALLAWIVVRLIGRRPSYEHELRRSVQEGHPLVEMLVIPQSRRIGTRNVHYLKPGSSARVGSGRSKFLIFFVPVPRRMAQLEYDGRTYTFVPLRKELFPEVEGRTVTDCLGKSIPARSLRGYRFAIIFRKFVPPLEEINRLMRSVLRPAAPAPTRGRRP